MTPPGYKQTEVGVIPEAWDTRPCSELSERIMVGIVIRPSQYYVRHGVPAFRSANIREDGITDIDLVFISDSSNALLAKSQTRTGDVLTVRTGYPGTSAVVRAAHAGCNCIDILITRPSKKLDSDWLAIWINSPFGKEQVLRNQGGLAQKHFNVGDMRNLVVALPPLPEQRAIATALSDVDALLAAQDRLIAKQRDLKQAAMQQLLTGQTRLPGFKGKWVPLNMADNSTLKARIGWQGLTTAEYLSIGDYFLVTGTDFADGRIAWSTCCFVAPQRYTQDRNIQLRSKDILLTKDGTIGKVAFVDNLPGPATLNSGVFVIRPKGGTYDPQFFYYILTSRVFDEFLNKLAAGSTISHLYQKDFVTFSFLAPPTIPEQTAIATVLSDMDLELAALEQRRDKTRALKQGMMQELLTGRTRLRPGNAEPQLGASMKSK